MPGAGNSSTTQNLFSDDDTPLNIVAITASGKPTSTAIKPFRRFQTVESCNDGNQPFTTFFDPEQSSVSVNMPGGDVLPFTVAMYDMFWQHRYTGNRKR